MFRAVVTAISTFLGILLLFILANANIFSVLFIIGGAVLIYVSASRYLDTRQLTIIEVIGVLLGIGLLVAGVFLGLLYKAQLEEIQFFANYSYQYPPYQQAQK